MEQPIKNRLLLVDDEKANLLVLNHIPGTDYILYTARDGMGAIKRAVEYLPDLILLDILMPGMDGYEVLSVLKNTGKTKDIPVIFITGLSGRDDEKKGLLLGADDYISKPFNNAVVQLRVRNQIRIVNQMRIIEQLSTRDHLTDLPNRRSFDKQLTAEWKRSVREQAPLSLLMIDMDNFKQYNDIYGHQQGDAALQALAKILTKTLKRPGDFTARWGGEEFVILLPSTDANGAWIIAEQIRANVESAAIPHADGAETAVTVSIGIDTQRPAKNDVMKEFFANADKALYAAKQEGKNRTRRYRPPADAAGSV